MTREKMLSILADELERVEEALPEGAHKHIANLRDGIKIGPGFEAAIQAMVRVEKECDTER